MFNLITSVFCVVFLSWPYSGAASDHNKSHIRSHHRTSIWQFYHNQVWSKGQPTPWVSGINTEPYCRDWKKKNQCHKNEMLQKASLSKYWSHSRGCDRYRWTKDGKDFEPPHMTTSDSDRTDGKMVLSYKNLIHFQGKYRCYASNKLGTAMTEEIQLIVAGKYHWPHAKMLRSCCVSSGFIYLFFLNS